MLRPSKRLIPILAMAGVLLNVDAAFGCSTKAKAYIAASKSALRNLVSAEESFFSDSGHFTTDLEALGFKPSTGANAPVIEIAGKTSYSATNTHSQLPGARCFIYVGAVPGSFPEAKQHQEGEPWCILPQSAGLSRDVSYEAAMIWWTVLLSLTLAAILFLRRPGKKSWEVRGLGLVSLLFVGIAGPLMSMCSQPKLEPIVVFLALGVGLFGLAVRRRVIEA